MRNRIHRKDDHFLKNRRKSYFDEFDGNAVACVLNGGFCFFSGALLDRSL